MSNKKGGAKELNLGLEALLSQSAKGNTIENARTDSVKPETTIVTVEGDLDTLRRELSALAQRGEWNILVGRAESAISSEEDIEARLWWIRGHLGAFTLPVSLLAAPFETVCRQLAGDGRVDTFSELLREVGEIVLGRLRDVGDRRQEYSVRLALCQLGVFELDEKSQKSYGKIPPKVPRFELGEVRRREEAVATVSKAEGRSTQLRTWWVVVALLFVLLSAAVVISRQYLAEPTLLTAREGLLGQDSSAAMQPPFVVARPVSSNLGALYYSMEKDRIDQAIDGGGGAVSASPAQASGRNDPGSGNASTSGDTSALPMSPRSSGQERPPAPKEDKRREMVRTDGPIEGTDFTKGVDRQSVPQAKLPEIVVPHAEAKPVPNLSYPDGSLNIGGEIKSALVQADVLDSPSYHARVIARLMPGDKVSVEGRVGQWLRIRSRRGRAGFVFAQDIGELEDFNVQGQEQSR
jgi:hypothetical protein